MNLLGYVRAYEAVCRMCEREWDYQTAFALLELKRKLQPKAEFYLREEMKLVKEYGVTDEKGQPVVKPGGRFDFKDPESAGEYAARAERLGEVTVQEQFEPVRMKAPDRITPGQIEALEGFVIFEREG